MASECQNRLQLSKTVCLEVTCVLSMMRMTLEGDTCFKGDLLKIKYFHHKRSCIPCLLECRCVPYNLE